MPSILSVLRRIIPSVHTSPPSRPESQVAPGTRKDEEETSLQLSPSLRTSASSSEDNSLLVDSSASVEFSSLPYTALILDIGDVLCTWSPQTPTSLPPSVIKRMRRSLSWLNYEKGLLTEHQCHSALAGEFNIPKQEVGKAFAATRTSVSTEKDTIALIRAWKQAQPDLRVFAMSNISAPDWDFLRQETKLEELGIFDRVFTSAEAGARKPDLPFYRRVIKEAGCIPSTTLFVDDKVENVTAARSLGLHGLVFAGRVPLLEHLRTLTSQPTQRGQSYLLQDTNRTSITNTGRTFRENFAELLILEATGNRALVDYTEHPKHFNFFRDVSTGTSKDFPCDFDTTSLGLLLAPHIVEQTRQQVMDEMLTYLNEEGIVQTYFDWQRPRIDPIVCTNVLTLFYTHQRGHQLSNTLEWVLSVLANRAYLDGTLYYHGSDPFLFFTSRLLVAAPALVSRIHGLLRDRVAERLGADGDALALAMRVIAAARVGLRAVVDYERLLKMQDEDGGWPMGWMYKYGASGELIGSRRLATAWAIQAIQLYSSL